MIGGVRGIGAVLAFGLGGFAAASNVRQLVLAARGAHRHGIGAWRGFVGRANGGMVVHIGVVVIAVALAAATSLAHRGEVTLRPGTTATVDGQRITFEKLVNVTLAGPHRHRGPGPGGRARPLPAGASASTGPTPNRWGRRPSTRTSWHDVYLTVDSLPATTGGPVGIGVTVQPLVSGCGWAAPSSSSGRVLAAVPGPAPSSDRSHLGPAAGHGRRRRWRDRPSARPPATPVAFQP